MAMHEFYIYDETTGEYLGKRMTSTRLPIWQEGVKAVRKESLPSDVRNNIIRAPNEFRLKGRGFEKLSKEEVDKVKRSKVIAIKKVIQ